MIVVLFPLSLFAASLAAVIPFLISAPAPIVPAMAPVTPMPSSIHCLTVIFTPYLCSMSMRSVSDFSFVAAATIAWLSAFLILEKIKHSKK